MRSGSFVRKSFFISKILFNKHTHIRTIIHFSTKESSLLSYFKQQSNKIPSDKNRRLIAKFRHYFHLSIAAQMRLRTIAAVRFFCFSLSVVYSLRQKILSFELYLRRHARHTSVVPDKTKSSRHARKAIVNPKNLKIFVAYGNSFEFRRCLSRLNAQSCRKLDSVTRAKFYLQIPSPPVKQRMGVGQQFFFACARFPKDLAYSTLSNSTPPMTTVSPSFIPAFFNAAKTPLFLSVFCIYRRLS